MKTNHLFLIAATAGMAMACGVEELADDLQTKEKLYAAEDSRKADMQLIYGWGYDTTDVRIFDEYYLVSNELVFYKDELKASRNIPQTRMNAEATRLTKEQQQICMNKVQMDATSISEILLEDAITEWNSIDDCNLFFSTAISYPSGAYADIEVTPTPMFASGSALVTVTPLIGNLNGRITINTGYYIWDYLSQDQRKYAIMHAMGHLIGLKDSDEIESHVDSTNYYDPNSIMRPSDEINMTNWGGYWNGLNDYDKAALKLMYPLRPIDDLEYEIYTVSDNGDESKVTNKTLYTGVNYRIKVLPFESVKPMEDASYGLKITYTDGDGTDIEAVLRKGLTVGEFEFIPREEVTVPGQHLKNLLLTETLPKRHPGNNLGGFIVKHHLLIAYAAGSISEVEGFILNRVSRAGLISGYQTE